MYGLIIEGARFMILENFGPQVLAQVLEIAQVGEKSISTHDIYSETIVPNMLRATCEITGMTTDQVGIMAGRFFVQFLIRHGYGDLMHVMGRRFSDFLKGLDNIHEYFRFSYPKIRPPSFYCSSESEDGLILHYRSRRQGYISYVVGQLVELARIFYKQELGVKIVKRKEKGKFLFVVIQLSFNNTGLGLDNRLKERVKNLNEYLPVDTISFLKMFPFHIAFNRKLDIIMCGQGLLNLMSDIPGQNMIDVFDLQKPCIKFTAEGCLAHENCNFQIESLHPVTKKSQEEITLKINGITEEKVEVGVESAEHKDDDTGEHHLPYVTLRGPIVYLKGCETFILLATCVVDGLDDMFRMGLFLNDYGDADCNREIIMASIQKSDHLKNLLQSEKQRSQVLTEMTREIADAKNKARQLLTQMMPVEVANTLLRTGRADQCESFDCVTIAFVKVVDFAKQTDQMSPVEIVNLLNSVYLIFDEIVDIHGVYKVETIGESYMISAGVPYRDDFDTVIAADCCLHMIAKIKESDMRFADGKKVQVKIGVFTGPCVAGIVGDKNPRYCLFGDTVNCASRMETHNKVPFTIQIGQRTKDRMDKQAPNKFKVKHRGMINVKGKGDMKAYEIVGKSGRPRYMTHPPKRPEIINEDPEECFDDIEDDHERTSALSRMSMNWGDSTDISRATSPSSRRPSDTGEIDTAELNQIIAQTLAQVSNSVKLDAAYSSGSLYPVKNRQSDQLLKYLDKKESTKRTQPKTFQEVQSRPLLVDKEPVSKHRAELEEAPSVISLASSTIQGRDDRLHEECTISMTSATVTPNINGDSTNTANNTPKPTNEFLEETKPEERERTMSTDFAEEPADRIPLDISSQPQSQANSSYQDDSTDPEELWRKDDRVEKKKRGQSKEMKSTRRLLESQKKKDAELKEKKVLPDIKKKATRDGSEKRSSMKDRSRESEQDTRGAHSHNGQGNCRCEDIRTDPKLKTKVCSIQ